MASVKPGQQINVIDIGTSKISVLVVQVVRSGSCELITHICIPSDGMRKGVIVDINRAVYAIRRAVTLAEQEAGLTIQGATINVSGSHVISMNSSGIVPIIRATVSDRDIENVLTAARAIRVPNGYKLLHVLPRDFTVDDGQAVLDPRGMHGIRLEARVHIIACGVSELQNILSCCQRAGIAVEDVVASSLASSEAVLTADERHLGVMLLDIGGGTTDMVCHYRGSVYHTAVLPVGGNHFTGDLAIGLRTTIDDAERVKCSWTNVFASIGEQESPVEISLVDGQQAQCISPTSITRIVRPRAEELVEMVKKEVERMSLHSKMTAGVVLTGGSSRLKGFTQLIQRMLECPVRIGKVRSEVPLLEQLLDPCYANVVGLLLCRLCETNRTSIADIDTPLIRRLISRLKLWLNSQES